MKVSDILKIKGDALFTVTPAMRLGEAIDLMAEKDVGSLVVLEAGELAGMLTFREIIEALRANSGQVGNETVRDHMDFDPLVASPDADIDDLRRLMLERHARYVPILEEQAVLGVISFYDVAKAILEAQGFENKMLKAFIRDSN